MRTGLPGRAGGALLLAVGVLLTGAGCTASATGSSAGAAPSASPTSSSAAPDLPAGLAAVADDDRAGLSGRLLQFRRDVASRGLEVRLVAANAGLVVEGLELHVPGLVIATGLAHEAALRQEPGLDLRVTMGVTDCAVQPVPPVAELQLRDDTGLRRTVDVPLDDDGLVQRLHDEDCAEQALLAEADIAVLDVAPTETPDGDALRVRIGLTRRSGDDPVRVAGTGSNTVYDITAVGRLPTLRQDPVTLVVDMLPARCDVHALGESYRTGLIGLVLALGEDDPRPFVLTPSDDVRRQLETFAVETCRAG
jgi:hypothetical protein